MTKTTIAPPGAPIETASKVDFFRSINPVQRASLAYEMAAEVGQHVERARSLVMVLAERMRAEGDDRDLQSLDLAEIADAWLQDSDHISQERRLMDCLRASVEEARK